MQLLTRSLGRVLDWIAPDSCAACQHALVQSLDLYCAECAASAGPRLQLRWLQDTPAWAIGSYEGPLETAIKRFKFAGHPELARRFAAALADALKAPSSPAESALETQLRRGLVGACLVPVPLHPLRLAERGYNQAALLAKALARSRQCDVQLRALQRLRHTTKQSRLRRDARLENLNGSIQVRRAPAGRVVLVDDVLTTGATLSQCRDVLRAAGVEVIAALTLAQTQ